MYLTIPDLLYFLKDRTLLKASYFPYTLLSYSMLKPTTNKWRKWFQLRLHHLYSIYFLLYCYNRMCLLILGWIGNHYKRLFMCAQWRTWSWSRRAFTTHNYFSFPLSLQRASWLQCKALFKPLVPSITIMSTKDCFWIWLFLLLYVAYMLGCLMFQLDYM